MGSIADAARADLFRLRDEAVDYMPGLSPEETRARLTKTSYRDFLLNHVKVHPDVVKLFQKMPHDLYCVGIDAVSANTCRQEGFPGFKGMHVQERRRGGAQAEEEEPYIFHFPDGNASVARLLVRALLPEAMPGNSMEDVVTAKADYTRLDRAGSGVRIRLNSTVISARHVGDPGTAREVDVTYVLSGKPYKVRGAACIMGAAALGSAWPAWQAARMSPLKALASRAETPRRRGLLLTLALAAALIALHPQPLLHGLDLDTAVPLYIFLGMPALLIGYFLLGVPLLALFTRLLGVPVARLLAVPPVLLTRSLAAMPYRYGLTAGALMTGLALMVATWTQGRAVMEDWLGRIQFPEVFVLGTNLKLEHQKRLADLPFVSDTVAISITGVESKGEDNQHLIALDGVTFIAFQPKAFFSLAKLTWIQGDVETAARRMEKGGAVIVAREYFASSGKGVGSRITLGTGGHWEDFEIVGVVSSPGLDLVNQYFEIGNAFSQQALHSVFGTREDLKDRLLGGSEPTTQLIQVGLKPETDPQGVGDAEAERRIREALEGTQILDVGNGRKLKNDISAVLKRSMFIISVIAVMSMLVACMGVANLIVAGIDARRFEFGVLRAVGARRGVILRLVLAEAVLVSLAAMVLGTLMGLQAVWAGQKVDAALLGIQLSVRPPAAAILAGCAVTLVMALGAAAPAVMALSRQKPRELLAAVRG